jgi:hypothetical protein
MDRHLQRFNWKQLNAMTRARFSRVKVIAALPVSAAGGPWT